MRQNERFEPNARGQQTRHQSGRGQGQLQRNQGSRQQHQHQQSAQGWAQGAQRPEWSGREGQALRDPEQYRMQKQQLRYANYYGGGERGARRYMPASSGMGMRGSQPNYYADMEGIAAYDEPHFGEQQRYGRMQHRDIQQAGRYDDEPHFGEQQRYDRWWTSRDAQHAGRYDDEMFAHEDEGRHGAHHEQYDEHADYGADYRRGNMAGLSQRGEMGRSLYGGQQSQARSYGGGQQNFGSQSYLGHQEQNETGGANRAWRGQSENYSGRGPKGYQRSDDRITEEVNDALADHPEIDASEIEVKVNEGVVMLTGSVDSRRAKRLVEDCIEHVRGVKDVQNQLKTEQVQSKKTAASNTAAQTMGSGSATSSATMPRRVGT